MRLFPQSPLAVIVLLALLLLVVWIIGFRMHAADKRGKAHSVDQK
jgi:fumarate reductase subunit D